MTLNFIFRLVLCSREDVSFNIISLNVLKGIKKVNLLMWFKKKKLLETPFKGNNVKALIKKSNRENLVLYCSEKLRKLFNLLCFFLFSVTKQSLENGFCFPQ